MKTQRNSRDGICKLTLRPGRFVDSHLIPAALTRLSRTGEKAIETGIGHGLKKRSNSWYDQALVTREGEDILAEIDARGIDLMRKYRLVWSGWGVAESISSEFERGGVPGQGWRWFGISDIEAKALRLFFISLLWRAGATNRPEFRDVSIPAEVLEDLRLRVLNRDPGTVDAFPIQLFQITTRGLAHNRTPRSERKRMPLTDTGWGKEIDYVRFYFEGLVAHVHIGCGNRFEPEYLASCLGGGRNRQALVFGHTFEDSRTWYNIKEMRVAVLRELRTPPFSRTVTSKAVRRIFPRDG